MTEAFRGPSIAVPATSRVLSRSRPAWTVLYPRMLVAADLLSGAIAGIAAYRIRFPMDSDAHSAYALVSVLFPLFVVSAIGIGRGYEARFLGTGSEEYRRAFESYLRLGGLTGVIAVALQWQLARGYLLIAFPLAIALSMTARYIARRGIEMRRRRGRCMHRVVAVGRERSVAELIRQVHRDRSAGFEVVAACLETVRPRDGAQVESVPVGGGVEDVLRVIREHRADTVAITAFSDLGNAEVRRLAWELEGTDVSMLVAPRITDVAGPRIHVRPVAGLPLLHVEQPEFTGGRRFAKNVLDRGAATLLLLLIGPLLVAVAVVVRLTSPGPAVFRQERVGVRGRNFTLWKFRTMHVDAEGQLATLAAQNRHAAGPLFKMAADPRVTPAGRWLRRFSVDELLQLFQVVTGRMSLVGPRPPLPAEVRVYEDSAHRRLLVKPGLTGLWQVSGRSDLSWEDSVRLDLYYVENWSLALDLVIIWKTVAAVLARRGAY